MNQPTPEIPKKHTCKDIIWSVIFLLVVFLWIANGIFGIIHGRIKTITAPRNSLGELCGIDYAVRDKPYLFYLELEECDDVSVPFVGCPSASVCIEECPQESFFYSSDIPVDVDKLYCLRGKKKWNPRKCAWWYLPSRQFKKRCLPSKQQLDDAMLNISKTLNKDVRLYELYEAVENLMSYAEVEDLESSFTTDTIRNYYILLFPTLVGILICCLYYFVPVSWYFVVLLPFLVAASFYIALNRLIICEETVEFAVWVGIASLLSLLVFILTIWLFKFRKKLTSSIKIVIYISKLFKKTPLSILSVLLLCILQFLTIIFAIIFSLYLTNVGHAVYTTSKISPACYEILEQKYNNGTKCDPKVFDMEINESLCETAKCKFRYFHRPPLLKAMNAYNVVGALWIILSVYAAEDIMVGYAVHEWILSEDSNLPKKTAFISLTVGFSRYIGTAALGSLLIGLYEYLLIKVALILGSNFFKQIPNPLANTPRFLDLAAPCLQKYIGKLTTNSFLMSAAFRENFFGAGKRAELLLSSYSLGYKYMPAAIKYLLFLHQLLVTFCTTSLTYVLILVFRSEPDQLFIPILLVFVIITITSSIFFRVFSRMYISLFLFYLEEVERIKKSPPTANTVDVKSIFQE